MSPSRPALSRARCTNHEGRQASGVCPTCARPFCRECLTEHDGRLSCASCLKRAEPARKRNAGWRRANGKLATPALLFAALLLSWFAFYLMGSSLEENSAPAAPASSGEKL